MISLRHLTLIEGICGLGGFIAFVAAFPMQSWLLLVVGIVLMAVGECANQAWKNQTGLTRDFE
jgi:hypothetical protein